MAAGVTRLRGVRWGDELDSDTSLAGFVRDAALKLPLVGFWISMVVGRYFYPRINRWIAITSTEGALLELDRTGTIPRPRRGANTTMRELAGAVVVVAIACVMTFSAGTSNMANAIAPLYGAGVSLNPLIVDGSRVTEIHPTAFAQGCHQ